MFTSLHQSNSSSPRKKFDVIVIGGGSAGCATTYYLSKAGADVALLEQFDLNTQASGRNAGSLHGQIQFEPFDELGMNWAKTFLPGLVFLADSIKKWKELSEELGVDLEVGGKGGLMVAEKISELKQLEEKVKMENSVGIPSLILSREELLAKAPYISAKMCGAAFSPIEGKANPLLVAPAFAHKSFTFGASINIGTCVTSIEKNGTSYKLTTNRGIFFCNFLVITSNATLPTLGKFLGLELPISNVPIQVSVTEQIEKFVHHLIYFTTEKLTFKQAHSGSLLIGGGWPARYSESGYPILNPDSLRANLRVALKVVPSISHIKVIRTWIGMGNGTPDHNPVIGEIAGHPNAFIGMYPYMGFTASPLLGEVLSELVLTGKSSRDISSFGLERFK